MKKVIFAAAVFAFSVASPAIAGIKLADTTPLSGITCKLNGANAPFCAKNGKLDSSLWPNVVRPWLAKVGFIEEFVTYKHNPRLGAYRQSENYYDRTVFNTDWRKDGKNCQTRSVRSGLKSLDRSKMIYCQLWGQGIEIAVPKTTFVTRKEHWELRKKYWAERREGALSAASIDK